MSERREIEVAESDLAAVRYEDCETCPACGEDTEPNEWGNAHCPKCAEKFKVTEQ